MQSKRPHQLLLLLEQPQLPFYLCCSNISKGPYHYYHHHSSNIDTNGKMLWVKSLELLQQQPDPCNNDDAFHHQRNRFLLSLSLLFISRTDAGVTSKRSFKLQLERAVRANKQFSVAASSAFLLSGPLCQDIAYSDCLLSSFPTTARGAVKRTRAEARLNGRQGEGPGPQCSVCTAAGASQCCCAAVVLAQTVNMRI